MCYADRSLEQATSTCAMCKVFPPRNNSYVPPTPPAAVESATSSLPRARRCPHKGSMGVCKNRANHPRHDVVHFRNAELSSFNGCGFCKVCLVPAHQPAYHPSSPLSGQSAIQRCTPQMLPGKTRAGQAAVDPQSLASTTLSTVQTGMPSAKSTAFPSPRPPPAPRTHLPTSPLPTHPPRAAKA